MKKPCLKNKPGFTLIETIMAIVIISILFYTLIAIFVTIIPRAQKLESIDKKIYLAQEKSEELLSRSFATIANVAATSFSGDFSNYYFSVDWTYVASTELNTAVVGPTNFKRVKISVWGGPENNSPTIEVITLVTSVEVQ
ncbi:MAG: type II secretion system protein [Candidatus Margulisiibacteriota bacterium]|jgi:prepilin-type N-terminal cleavage/methylation domain-containing protein